MRHTTFGEYHGVALYAEQFAKKFAQDSNLCSAGDLTPGSYLGLRWGLGNDCVLIVKLAEDFEPLIFGQIIPKDSK